ncbi:uncharacterized protein LOC108481256 [Gossypium arboreum]|uniref:uncharacterized protein LOC108481256 n=1 Tax=Gossypium arboreum TaxID=29729 RepID=UPI0008195948|nr:uncharacterized protein LOC108481256 [Gossypium arboreum]
MFVRLSLFHDGSLLAELQVKPRWIEQIKDKQLEEESLGSSFRQIENGETSDFGLNSKGILYFHGRVCVAKDTDLRQFILQEVHNSPYAMHPGENKMYQDLQELHWRPGLKREVKAEHQLPSGLLQIVKIPLWKWERKLAKLYVSEIVRLHGVPIFIISDRDPRFTSQFRKKLHEALGTRLDFSSMFYP